MDAEERQLSPLIILCRWLLVLGIATVFGMRLAQIWQAKRDFVPGDTNPTKPVTGQRVR